MLFFTLICVTFRNFMFGSYCFDLKTDLQTGKYRLFMLRAQYAALKDNKNHFELLFV